MLNPDTQSSAVVSFDAEELILVDDSDTEIGYASKSDCHDGEGLLHRAFSVLIFNRQGELLLQQRNEQKRLWGGFWSNSCCSHPRRGETMAEATNRRLQQELGLTAKMTYLYKFSYAEQFGDLGSERELCHVYAGISDAPPVVNHNEIQAWRYLSASALERELSDHPSQFTPWFKQEWQMIKDDYSWLLTAEGIATCITSTDAARRKERRAQ